MNRRQPRGGTEIGGGQSRPPDVAHAFLRAVSGFRARHVLSSTPARRRPPTHATPPGGTISLTMVGSTVSHYKVLSKLGEGGMGVVYKAEDTRLERTVALKFLAQELTRDEENRKRFLREAKAAAGINHPNVCTVHETRPVRRGRRQRKYVPPHRGKSPRAITRSSNTTSSKTWPPRAPALPIAPKIRSSNGR